MGAPAEAVGPDDARIDQFIAALRVNSYTHPEPGASCNEIGPEGFLQDNPPAFQPIPAADDPAAVTETSPDASEVVPDSATPTFTVVPTDAGAAPTRHRPATG